MVKSRAHRAVRPCEVKQNQGAEGFIATGLTGAETAAASKGATIKGAAIKGMEAIAEKYRAGGDLYMPAGRRERDYGGRGYRLAITIPTRYLDIDGNSWRCPVPSLRNDG